MVPQRLSTSPFCSWCLGAAVVNLIFLSEHYFLKVSDMNSEPASDQMWLMLFILLSLVGMLEVSNSIPSIQASDDLSLIPMSLKIREYLSHMIRK